VSITEDMMGSSWEQEGRSLRLEFDELLRTGYLSQRVHAVTRVTYGMAEIPTEGKLVELMGQLALLEREVQKYEALARRLHDDVGTFLAAVHVARENGHYENPPDPFAEDPEKLEEQRLEDLGVDRLGALYENRNTNRRRP